MKNKVLINSDGINVYIDLIVNSNKIAKVLLALFSLIFLFFLIYIISLIDIKSNPKLIFPIVILIFLVFYFVGRYCLWNLYGSEHLIINKTSISYFLDYGLYKTNLNTTKVGSLGVGFDIVRKEGKIEIGDIVFVDYENEAKLPFDIYRTSVLVSRDDLKLIENKISKIMMNEMDEKYNFISFSEN